jgi:hypothetical protein
MFKVDSFVYLSLNTSKIPIITKIHQILCY